MGAARGEEAVETGRGAVSPATGSHRRSGAAPLATCFLGVGYRGAPQARSPVSSVCPACHRQTDSAVGDWLWEGMAGVCGCAGRGTAEATPKACTPARAPLGTTGVGRAPGKPGGASYGNQTPKNRVPFYCNLDSSL